MKQFVYFASILSIARGDLTCNGAVNDHSLHPEGVCLSGESGQGTYSLIQECNDEDGIDTLYYASSSDCTGDYQVVDVNASASAVEIADWICSPVCTLLFAAVGKVTTDAACYAVDAEVDAECLAVLDPLDPLAYVCITTFDGFLTAACMAAVKAGTGYGKDQCISDCDNARRRRRLLDFGCAADGSCSAECGQETCSDYVVVTRYSDVTSCDPLDAGTSGQDAFATDVCVDGVTYECTSSEVTVSSFGDDDCSGTAESVSTFSTDLNCDASAGGAVKYECFASDDTSNGGRAKVGNKGLLFAALMSVVYVPFA